MERNRYVEETYFTFSLAEHPARSTMRLVALTGYGQESDHRNSQEAGFDLHLVKPLELARLRELQAGL
jgi:CheY-like chemotaxis protein